MISRGPWAAQLVKYLPWDSGSGPDLKGVRWGPASGSVRSTEPAQDFLLSPSVSTTNKLLNKKGIHGISSEIGMRLTGHSGRTTTFLTFFFF